MNYLAQVIGIIGVFFWVYSVQHKKQKEILFYQFLANLSYAIQYAILNVFTASAMNMSSVLRCLIFYNLRKNKKDISIVLLIVFLILIIFLGIITYNGLLSLIPVIITIFYTVSSWLKDTKWTRIVFILAAFAWIFYNFQVGTYPNIIGNIFEIISGTISLHRFEKK